MCSATKKPKQDLRENWISFALLLGHRDDIYRKRLRNCAFCVNAFLKNINMKKVGMSLTGECRFLVA